MVVLGNGPLGLMAAGLAKLRGAGFVAITGLPRDNAREKARFAAAEKLGCDMTIETGRESVEEKVKARFPKGVDRVIVSSPPESMADAFKIIALRRDHHLLRPALRRQEHDQPGRERLLFRKISLIPTFAEPAINFPVAIRLLRDGLIDAEALVTHTFGFAEARQTMAGIVDGSLPAIKAVMLPNG